jgi:hypothetical protein
MEDSRVAEYAACQLPYKTCTLPKDSFDTEYAACQLPYKNKNINLSRS